MIKGKSFLGNVDESKKRHLRIVISDESVNNKFLTVPVITYHKEYVFCDTSCLIEIGEHSFITRLSCIDYRHAEEFSFAKIYNGIQQGIFIRKEDISPKLLLRIQEGAKMSKFLPNKFKGYFELF